MAKIKLSDEAQVAAHIDKLEPGIQETVREIRAEILETSPEIGERIKWNNPSFYYTGDMPDFDPKEYRREIAVFNLFKGRIMLVFTSGAKVNDTTGFLEGDYKDGRRTVTFSDLEDARAKKAQLQEVIRKWLSLL